MVVATAVVVTLEAVVMAKTANRVDTTLVITTTPVAHTEEVVVVTRDNPREAKVEADGKLSKEQWP